MLRPPVPELDEDECEVVDEEERVGQAEGELHEPWVRHVLLLAVRQVAAWSRNMEGNSIEKYNL